MPLLGAAAMLLSFDIAAETVAEHDDWHTHEHLPERLSIPGFLRGSRWRACSEGPGYFVFYEVADLAVLDSQAYLDRLEHPTPWTTAMMKAYRGMNRGLCRVVCSLGSGLGQSALLVRFAPAVGADGGLRDWLLGAAMPALPSQRGLSSVHLFESALTPRMTAEQRIRGQDAPSAWALLVTGYEPDAVARLAAGELGRAAFEQHGAAPGVVSATYGQSMTLLAGEVGSRA